MGSPRTVNGENHLNVGLGQTNKYATILDFPRFGGEGVEEWIFKMEQFFVLNKISEIAKINVIALYLDGCALHWHKNFLKNKERGVE